MRIRIGTRGSELALLQTNLVAVALENKEPGLETELVLIKTTGDKRQGTPDEVVSDKRKWIYELELALLDGSIDIAVHSAKDVPSSPHQETALLPVLARENPHDFFIGAKHASGRWQFKELPKTCQVGTASLRRRAQLLRLRSDLNVVDCRGNVSTRIRKLDQGGAIQGLVLAGAGLTRLGVDLHGFEELPYDDFLPAVNQGMLVVQYLKSRSDLESLAMPLVDPLVRACFEAERACVATLRADCYSCVGVLAEVHGDKVSIRGRVLGHDGRESTEASQAGAISEAWYVGERAGTILNDQGAQELLAWGRRNM